MKNNKIYTVGELFSGCGGFSLGAKLTGRCRHVWAVDRNEDALKTYKQMN